MIAGNREQARMQSDFYRDWYYKLLRLLVIESAIMLALILAILYLVFFQPPPQFYATATSGKLVPLYVGE